MLVKVCVEEGSFRQCLIFEISAASRSRGEELDNKRLDRADLEVGGNKEKLCFHKEEKIWRKNVSA